MKSRLNIPNKIAVGFQEREDTYTKRLAYVVYYDAKGVLRKERSWNGWRDNKIPQEDFENTPTEGFVLNKKVGDYSSRWGGRRAAIRIYDPRGFEFEIDADNLLFILEHCSSIKGKGIEGEFVYAWDGSNLVLLPASCEEYKESLNWTKLQTKKVTKSDMVEGCLYKNKDGDTLMYLGRHKWFEIVKNYNANSIHLDGQKYHIFVNVNSTNDNPYWIQKGFTKLAERLTEVAAPNFADEYDKFKSSKWADEFDSVVYKKENICFKTVDKNYYYYSYYNTLAIKKGSNYYNCNLQRIYKNWGNPIFDGYRMVVSSKPMAVEKTSLVKHKLDNSGYLPYRSDDPTVHTKEQIAAMDFYKVLLKTKNGSLIQI